MMGTVTKPAALETVDLETAKLLYAGDNGVEDRGEVKKITRSLVLQFDSVEKFRQALADGACTFEW
jgi:hypothetical protein